MTSNERVPEQKLGQVPGAAMAIPSKGATATEWRRYAQSLVPGQGCLFARNQRITGLYAELYLRHPDCFKWAGMAAYASHHVRLALLPLRLATGPTGCRITDAQSRRSSKLNPKDVEVLRRTNDHIFADIYWAHLVYGGSAEGLKTLSEILEPGHESMLLGFESIEEGRVLLEQGDEGLRKEGERLVWAGNTQLLRHEQELMVQPLFESLSAPFSHVFSAASSLGFTSGRPMEYFRLFCSFYMYMATGGVFKRQRPPLLPNITHLPDRWSWISQCILPKFQLFESRATSPIKEQLEHLVELAGGGADGDGLTLSPPIPAPS